MTEKRFQVWSHGSVPIPIPGTGQLCRPNTLAAFEAAIATGVDGIEADVCCSLDRKPIIYHPALSGYDPRQMLWEEIRSSCPWVPSLGELATLLIEHPQIRCFLDMKDGAHDLLSAIIRMIEDHGLYSRFIITAPRARIPLMGQYTDWRVLDRAKSTVARVRTHVIDTLPLNMAGLAKKARANIISFGWFDDSVLSKLLFNAIFRTGLRKIRDEVVRAQETGVSVLGGIVSSREALEYFLEAGVDGVVVEDPAMALSFRANQKP